MDEEEELRANVGELDSKEASEATEELESVRGKEIESEEE